MSAIKPSPRVLARYATDPSTSRGRRIPEGVSQTRTAFQRDRDRVIHAAAFRRLTHKTQVFITTDGDHYRSRLTHSLEVAQIARSIARVLQLDEDLAEALALAHDFGHTPFGHEGENVLAEKMAAHGGFDHNVQAYRIVTRLERRYAHFDGLNLTFEMLEGLIKHNGPPSPAVAEALNADGGVADLNMTNQAGLEAQVAALSDDIAYDAHDVDDGLRSGILHLSALDEVAITRDIRAEVTAEAPGLEPARVHHEIVRRLLTRLIEDVIAETVRRMADAGVETAGDVVAHNGPLVGFSPAIAEQEAALHQLLRARLYSAPQVLAVRADAGKVLSELFDIFAADPSRLPDPWRKRSDTDAQRLRRTCDYIAGMTDRFALSEHQRLIGGTPSLALGR